jgi:hypothetical protein
MKIPKKWNIIHRMSKSIDLEWNIVESDVGLLIQEIDFRVCRILFYTEEEFRELPNSIMATSFLTIFLNSKIEYRNSQINNLLKQTINGQ